MNKQVQPHEKELTGTLEWILVGGVGEEIAIGLFPARKNWCGLVWIELASASVAGNKQESGSGGCAVLSNGTQQTCSWLSIILDRWEV